MSRHTKLVLLRVGAVVVLLFFLNFLARQPEEKTWWFWFVPVLAVYLLYRVVLSRTHCSECREAFALHPVNAYELRNARAPTKIRFSCEVCGNEEYKWIGGPTGGGGGRP